MKMINYIISSKPIISIPDKKFSLSNNRILSAIQKTNTDIKSINDCAKIDISAILGMRNLSAFVGEVFGSNIIEFSNDKLIKNPHQDGYPDLLLIDTKERIEYFESIITRENGKIYPKEKHLFSPYLHKGLEVKATCGNTPSASIVPKPLIGESRIDLLTSFEWKAHHRETEILVGILWDFIDSFPTVIACFFRNDLTIDDWGETVTPTKGGGRTTSVSIMKQVGVKKMCKNWIAVIDDEKYIKKLSSKKWIGYNIKTN